MTPALRKHRYLIKAVRAGLALVTAILATVAAVTVPSSSASAATNSPSAGPTYWSTYGYNVTYGKAMPEDLWKDNIDWLAQNFRDSGYRMATTDGWVGNFPTDSHGYMTSMEGWTHSFGYWAKYLAQRNMSLGVYMQPLWILGSVVKQDPVIEGTNGIHVSKILHDCLWGDSDGGCYIYEVDINAPGAEQWVKGYIRHFIGYDVKMLTTDFDNSIESLQGSAAYAEALRWIKEAAGSKMLIKQDINYCFNSCSAEAPNVDVLRITDDVGTEGWGWKALATNQAVTDCQNVPTYPAGPPAPAPGDSNYWLWYRWGNAWDGLSCDAAQAAKENYVMDPDFIDMNTFASNAERQTAMSLYLMAGASIGMTDYCNNDTTDTFATQTCTRLTSSSLLNVYTNPAANALNRGGFRGHPLNGDDQRWVGQVSIDGKRYWVVGLFNRTDTQQTRSIDMDHDLGLTNQVKLKDLWTGTTYHATGGYQVSLAPHASQLLILNR